MRKWPSSPSTRALWDRWASTSSSPVSYVAILNQIYWRALSFELCNTRTGHFLHVAPGNADCSFWAPLIAGGMPSSHLDSSYAPSSNLINAMQRINAYNARWAQQLHIEIRVLIDCKDWGWSAQPAIVLCIFGVNALDAVFQKNETKRRRRQMLGSQQTNGCEACRSPSLLALTVNTFRTEPCSEISPNAARCVPITWFPLKRSNRAYSTKIGCFYKLPTLKKRKK